MLLDPGSRRGQASSSQPGLLAVPLTFPCFATLWPVTGAHAANSVADALHRSIMIMQPRYPQYSEQKALAGCFDWRRW